MIVDEVKPSLEELRHYGTKGMKWGVRKANPTGSEIRSARIRQHNRFDRLGAAARDLNLATADGSKAQQKAAVKKYNQAQKDFMTNEDRVTAARMTKGEKVASFLLTGPGGLVVLGVNKLQVKSTEKSVEKARRG